MKFSNVVWIVFLGLVFLSLGLRWVQSLDNSLEENSYQIGVNSKAKSDNPEKVKKENSCGDKVCSIGESYQSCSKDCGYSLLGECIKSCTSNQKTGDDEAIWKGVCEQQCNIVESEYNSMMLQAFSQEEKEFMQKEKESMLNTFIEEFKNN